MNFCRRHGGAQCLIPFYAVGGKICGKLLCGVELSECCGAELIVLLWQDLSAAGSRFAQLGFAGFVLQAVW
jgi:hypothetical protein